jgi:anaerobic magnesium-protoporphyrin IX monomethyl ester cyclase
MSIVLINPNLVVQRNDPFTTGIVYMPIGLAYTAAALRDAGYEIKVIDAFAEEPEKGYRYGDFTLHGLTQSDVIELIPDDVNVIFIFAINLTNHISAVKIANSVKLKFPEIPIILLENTQAVTAYALKNVREEFFEAGADFILTGEPEIEAVNLVRIFLGEDNNSNLRSISGLGTPDYYTPVGEPIHDLDGLSFPAWDLFPLENYWKLKFAHGPQSTSRYLPLLTSRGCPYSCRFCVVPETNKNRWRSRSAVNIVDEMEYYLDQFQVHEFHLEDLDPTISDQRTREISREIIHRDLDIIWKIAAGTKVETIKREETIDLMAKSGCRYISISPETGSAKVLDLMKKPFNLEHAVRIVRRMNQVGIYSQACFVLGFPGEDEEDRVKTWNLVHDLTKKGVDEIALFIITPVPGSAIFDEFKGYDSLSEMNFTPTWRQDYKILNRFRLRLYVHFLWWKLRYHPLKLIRQPFNFIRKRYDTKMEMVPYRALWLMMADRRAAHEG